MIDLVVDAMANCQITSDFLKIPENFFRLKNDILLSSYMHNESKRNINSHFCHRNSESQKNSFISQFKGVLLQE